VNFRTPSWPTGRSWIQRVSLGVAVAAVKVARCMLGHGPFLGLTGPGKFVYWAGRCQDTEWEKW
jgi:hypothetical protein